MRTNVYVDGYNLYYGCLKGTPYKWLDLTELCRRLAPRDNVHRIRYFTARITARLDDPDGPTRQDTYLRALATFPEISVHLGRFQERLARMAVANPPPRTIEVLKTEEKGSDVNLATYLLADVFRGECEKAIVVSNDSDLKEPIRVVIHELGIQVGLVNPHPASHRSRDLLTIPPTFFKQIWPKTLKASQLSTVLRDDVGEIHKPARW